MAGGDDHQELALRILRDAPVAIVVLDAQGRIEHINPFLERRTGYRLDEVRGKDWFEVILPERERERRRAMFRQLLAGDLGRVTVRPIWTRSGERLMLEGNDELLRDDAGEPTGAIIVGHDVTNRVRIEEHLQQAQAMARVGSFERDLTTNQTWWSDELFRLVGQDPQVTKPSFEAFLATVHPDDRERLVAAFEQGRTKGEAYEIEHRVCSPDGTIRHIRDRIRFVLDEQGRATRLQGTVLDVSAQVQAELRLRQREARLAAVFDHTSDAMLLLSVEKDGMLRVAAANRSFVERLNLVTPVQEADLLGLSMEQLTLDVYKRPPDVLAQYLESLRRVIATRTPLAFEHMMVFPTGPFFAEVSIVPVLDDAGACVHLLWSSRDVTARVHAEQQRARLEEQLRHAQKMESLGTLAGGIAHDFNNLLTVIMTSLELAHTEVAASGHVAELLESIRVASSRAHELVKQILAFSRQQPARRSVTPVRAVVEEAALLLRATIPAGIQIVVDVQRAVPRVLIDATQIHQVLVNLATNAWHAIDRPTGTVTLRLETVELDAPPAPGLRPGRYARLQVCDDGHGMDAATLQRIFEPFFTTKGVGKGSGLGLAVAHGIVASHDGAITVDSAPGRGTTFSVYLPETTEGPAPAKKEPAPAGRPGGRVLLLDDEEQLVRVGKLLLERCGYDVTGFVRPEEAIAAVRADPRAFDVVVTDRNMPGMGGLEVARAVGALRSDLPVVLVSGHGVDSDEELVGANIRHQVSKPYTSETLGRALAAAMKR